MLHTFKAISGMKKHLNTRRKPRISIDISQDVKKSRLLVLFLNAFWGPSQPTKIGQNPP